MFGFDDPFGTKDKNAGRDKRRAFTVVQKNEILAQQGNKCAICKKPLDMRAKQFDHQKGWADKGRTVTQNGRALCPNCHSIKTHDDRLAKIEGKKPAKKKPVTKKATTTMKTTAKKKAPSMQKKSSLGLFDMSLPDYKMPELKMPKKPKGGFGLF